MATRNQRIAAVKSDAKLLRYCGMNARADLYMMQVVVRTPMTWSECRQLQDICSPHTSVIIHPDFVTGN